MTQPNPLTDNMSYTEILDYYLGQWGLSDLADLVDQLGRTGATSDQINLELQQTPEWKQRFAGNEIRMQNGLAPLDPATYIGMESSYQQILSQLPAGFYDGRDHMAQLIGGNVSASELAQRVQDANDLFVNNPASGAAMLQYAGGSRSHAVAALLDPTVADSLIQQQVTQAQIGGAALESGLQLTRADVAQKAAQQGVTLQTARQAYTQIAQRLSTDKSISQRFQSAQPVPGLQPFGQTEEEQATLLGDATAQRRQQTLYAEEQAQFSGHGAASPTSGSPGTNY